MYILYCKVKIRKIRKFTKNGEEVHVLLFEKLSTAHTGNIKHEKTQTHYPKI